MFSDGRDGVYQCRKEGASDGAGGTLVTQDRRGPSPSEGLALTAWPERDW